MKEKLSYSEQLKDPRWQKKRLEIMERDDFCCRYCDDTEKTLNIHHEEYVSGKYLWEHDNITLMTICEDCHKRVTENLREIKRYAHKYFLWDIDLVNILLRSAVNLYPNNFENLIEISKIIDETRDNYYANINATESLFSLGISENHSKKCNDLIKNNLIDYINKSF